MMAARDMTARMARQHQTGHPGCGTPNPHQQV